jgi:hypothetical protein
VLETTAQSDRLVSALSPGRASSSTANRRRDEECRGQLQQAPGGGGQVTVRSRELMHRETPASAPQNLDARSTNTYSDGVALDKRQDCARIGRSTIGESPIAVNSGCAVEG